MVHFVYTWRRQKIKYVKVNPAKLKLQEIKNEQWPGIVSKVTAPSREEE
jgi:alpha-L-rhamnosidase